MTKANMLTSLLLGGWALIIVARRAHFDASEGTGAPEATPATTGNQRVAADVSSRTRGLTGRLGRIVVPAVAALSLLGLTGVTPAQASSPWWQVTSSAAPTDLVPGTGTDEVQELTVSATGGEFSMAREEFSAAVGHVEETRTKNVLWDATPRQVEEALEEAYGPHNVQVSSPRAGAYVVRFVEELADRRLHPILTYFSELTGPDPAATVTETTIGRPAGKISLVASNIGVEELTGEGSPVRIVDRLPAGLTAIAARGEAGPGPESSPELEPLGEDGTLTVCHVLAFGQEVECTYHGLLPAFQGIRVEIALDVESRASGGVNEATVEGGEGVEGGKVAPASVTLPVQADGAPTPFGISDYEVTPENEGGARGREADTQAGSHPFQTTFTVSLNEGLGSGPEELGARWGVEAARFGTETEAANAKDLYFNLPQGLFGNPTALPQCTDQQFSTIINFQSECPPDTAVGVAIVTISHAQENSLEAVHTLPVPVFNLVPSVGEPAKLGFEALNSPVVLDTALRSGRDYGVVTKVSNITQIPDLISSKVIIWGVPGAASHNNARGWECLQGNVEGCAEQTHESNPQPFFTLPTSCEGPLVSNVEGDSWGEAAEGKPLREFSLTKEMESLTGCEKLPFKPAIEVAPDIQSASTASGLNVAIHVPQEASLNQKGLANSEVRDISVTLPAGVALNPSGGDGLEACSESQIGFLAGEKALEGEPAIPGRLFFSPTLPEPISPGLNLGAEGFCPNASKIANVTIKTPLLPNPITGFVYLASPQNFHTFPQENPFQSLLAMYIVAEDPVSGTLVKLPGKVELGGEPGVEGLAPGQIRSTFEDNPELPFEEAELHFFGEDRSPLATPSRCGTYTTSATFTPWSGEEPVTSQSSFQITSGPGGGACPGAALPFSPSLATGTTSNNAGAFSALTTTISREDGQQDIQQVQLHYPPGLSGILSGVKLCGEAEANAGTCGSESQIGETTVSVGVGNDPFTVTGGKVYLTEKIAGSPPDDPFGLSIVNPAKAGPFDLQEGRPVIVRATIEVNPTTTALTVTSGAIPTIIEGIPLQIRHVNVTITRPGFTFNPTSCNPLAVSSTIVSAEGASAPVSIPFQVTNCANLKFEPKFTASTSGKTSKARGASLTLKVTRPSGPTTNQANFALAKIELPKALPSRLTTLQKACTAAQFDANPAGCPAASDIGHVKVVTPELPVPLEGPAYFVSHGGEAFPSVIFVLQGYGVTVDVVSTTFISKAGITSATIKQAPDAPFTSFELSFPEGNYSALAANGNLCTKKLAMPTEFIAQNGLKIKQSTPIGVSGCKKVKALTRAQKLARALKACHKKKSKSKREACERTARKRFGPLKKSKSSKKKGGR